MRCCHQRKRADARCFRALLRRVPTVAVLKEDHQEVGKKEAATHVHVEHHREVQKPELDVEVHKAAARGVTGRPIWQSTSKAKQEAQLSAANAKRPAVTMAR